MSHLELYQILALALAILVSGYFSEIWPDWAPAKFLVEFARLGRFSTVAVYFQLITDKTNTADLVKWCIRTFNCVTRTIKIQNQVLFHKFYQKLQTVT